MVDTRPHDHRAKEARKARRLNHAFRYLYRHDNGAENLANLSSTEYLQTYGGYSLEQIQSMTASFPVLLELDVRRHLHPKMRFLKETMLGMTLQNDDDDILPASLRESLPPFYYGARLERLVAPRHAFLKFCGLPHGRELLMEKDDDDNHQNHGRWQDFLKSCRNTKQFASLCNTWAASCGNMELPADKLLRPITNNSSSATAPLRITPKHMEAFDALFARGLMAAARDELCQHNNTWPLLYLNITAGELMELLMDHGANPLERDNRGVSLLHWAAGTGNLQGVQALQPYFSSSPQDDTTQQQQEDNKDNNHGFFTQAERDGATPLHWAAAGSNAREFGVGGHADICHYILSQLPFASQRKALVQHLTKDGNSALMWAAWSGTLETVQFLIRNRADATMANRNGCTVAHWAASGGNVEVCQYLAKIVGVNFQQANHGGNTPLTHAVAFGRVDVVEWLRRDIVNDSDQEDTVAADLAWDFVGWTDGQDPKRREVLKLFLNDNDNDDDDDYWAGGA